MKPADPASGTPGQARLRADPQNFLPQASGIPQDFRPRRPHPVVSREDLFSGETLARTLATPLVGLKGPPGWKKGEIRCASRISTKDGIMHRAVKVRGNPAQHKEVGPMSYRRVSQIALVVLTSVLLACAGDTVTPTAPALDGFGTLTSEGHAPAKKCSPWPACKDGETVEHSYSLTFTGNVSGATVQGVNTRDTEIRVKAGTEDAWLDIATFIAGKIDSGELCFATITNTVTNVFSINDASDYRVTYKFDAFADDGIKSLRYTLAMKDGNKTSGNWLPEHSSTAVLTFDAWEMVHSGKGGKKGACLGAGNFDSQTVTVVHTGLISH